MPRLKGDTTPETAGWYSQARHTSGAEVGVHSLELATEKLMEISQSDSPSEDQLRHALAGYVELIESARNIHDSLERVEMMRRVTGQNLLGKV